MKRRNDGQGDPCSGDAPGRLEGARGESQPVPGAEQASRRVWPAGAQAGRPVAEDAGSSGSGDVGLLCGENGGGLLPYFPLQPLHPGKATSSDSVSDIPLHV